MPDHAAPVLDDPITFAVVKNAIDAIVDEVAYTVIRTARSEIVKDVMDYSAAICDAHGEMVGQAKTIAQHLGAIPEAMASVQAEFGDDLAPGDAVVMNDPYLGGMHLPDVFMFYPVFVDGAILAWTVVICHHTDMGGRVPGSNAADSTEIFQEGLRIPPLKLFKRGSINRTLERIIAQNVRVPDRVLGDLRAQYAACQVGAREIGRLVRRYGAATLRGYFGVLLDYAERMTRAEIATWPKGTYRFTDHIDSDGLSDAPVPLSVAVTVHGDGDRLLVDWSGSSPQVRAAINATLSFTKSNTFLSVRCALRAMTRGHLYAAILEAARRAGVEILTQSEAVGAHPDGVLHFADGSSRTADLVIAADGVRSAVRDSIGLVGMRCRYQDGIVRVLVERSGLHGGDWEHVTDFWASVPRILRILYAPCENGLLYFAMMAPLEDRQAASLPIDPAVWASCFPTLAPALAQIGDRGRYDVYETTKLDRWSLGRVAIVGDSAHAMPPTLAQGAGCAMMNALAVADAVSDGGDLVQALARWEAAERPLTDHTQARAAELASTRALGNGMQWDDVGLRAARHVPTATDPAAFANLPLRIGN